MFFDSNAANSSTNKPVYRSLVNPGLAIDEDNWCISIIRKQPRNDGSGNPEHAFLILEGIHKDSNKVTLWRYDLVVDEDRKGYAKVIINVKAGLEQSEGQIVFQNKLLSGDNYYAMTWSLAKEKGEKLDKAILADQAKEGTEEQIRYSLVGNQSAMTSSNTGSSRRGHNCFTWARMKLIDLNDTRIQIPTKWTDYIASRTSRHIKPLEKESTTKCTLS